MQNFSAIRRKIKVSLHKSKCLSKMLFRLFKGGIIRRIKSWTELITTLLVLQRSRYQRIKRKRRTKVELLAWCSRKIKLRVPALIWSKSRKRQRRKLRYWRRIKLKSNAKLSARSKWRLARRTTKTFCCKMQSKRLSERTYKSKKKTRRWSSPLTTKVSQAYPRVLLSVGRQKRRISKQWLLQRRLSFTGKSLPPKESKSRLGASSKATAVMHSCVYRMRPSVLSRLKKKKSRSL